MDLITTDAQLRANLPNVFSTATGEKSLYEKLDAFLRLSEMWAISTLVSETLFETICTYNPLNHTRRTLERLVVTDAMIRAIPSLDLVLTPNGFGVVSNPNIAPASKERVERLIASLRTSREDCIAQLLPQLAQISDWRTSQQAKFFGKTLFPDYTILDLLGVQKSWENYLATRQRILHIELSLAEEYFSHELLDTLRSEIFADKPRDSHQFLIDNIRSQIVAILLNQPIIQQRMMDIVNFIRSRPDEFPEWHSSDTAQLFSPPKFENKKDSKGYFF